MSNIQPRDSWPRKVAIEMACPEEGTPPVRRPKPRCHRRSWSMGRVATGRMMDLRCWKRYRKHQWK